jgi:uncharacterized repeat protein (TIGR03806 family)
MQKRLVLILFAFCLTCSQGTTTGGGKPVTPVTPSGPKPPAEPVDPTRPVTPGVPAPFGLDARPENPTCVAPARPLPAGGVGTQRAFPSLNFDAPLAMVQAPGDSTRFYVIEQEGVLKVFNNAANVTAATTALDLTARVDAGGEKGLLGIAFHPSFATNRYVFLSYTRSGGETGLQSIVSRFTFNAAGTTADPASEKPILTVDQPYDNHNGGGIAFGPDGFLYIGLGDGGSGGDPQNYAQNLNSLLGKFLRIDVNNGTNYAIPPSNPFAQGGGRAEIFAWGLRNPWRWSFDRATGELWAGDVGQGALEEVDKIVIGGNYGWRIKEGNSCFNPNPCSSAGLIDPVVQYPRSQGISITGGFVYRGTAIPTLVGRFVFGDFSSGRVWAVTTDANGATSSEPLLDTNFQIASFAEDAAGELYILHIGGELHKLVPQGNPNVGTFPGKLSETGCVEPSDARKAVAGAIPYDVNAALWSDGAFKQRHLAVPDGQTVRVNDDGDWEFPNGTVLMKTFFVGTKRVETRLFIRHPDGVWAGYSYEWNDEETDAILLAASKVKTVGDQTWYFPSRAECLQCHTAAAGRSLGLETAQLNKTYQYPNARISHQIATLNHIGMFAGDVGDIATLPKLPDPNGSESVAARARSYLHGNCSGCHRPNGTGRGPADLRFSTALASAAVCNTDPTQGDLGINGAKLLAPGQPARSLLSVRMHRLDANRMPPVASRVVDRAGTDLVDAWITGLTACP